MDTARYENMTPIQKKGIEHILASSLWDEDLADEPLGKWPDEETFVKFFVSFTVGDLKSVMPIALSWDFTVSEEYEVWISAHQALEQFLREDILPNFDINRMTLNEIHQQFCERYDIVPQATSVAQDYAGT